MSMDAQRQAREAELVAMLETGNGRFDLLDLFQQMEIELPYEADLRTELIPAILDREFPRTSTGNDEENFEDLRRSNPR